MLRQAQHYIANTNCHGAVKINIMLKNVMLSEVEVFQNHKIQKQKTSPNSEEVSLFLNLNLLFHRNLIHKNVSFSTCTLMPFWKFSEVIRFYFYISCFSWKNRCSEIFYLNIGIFRIDIIL